MVYNWISFDQGKSIGMLGSEGGKIIKDEENTFGARVTLEGKGDIAPFSITLGVYGLLFHTEFFSQIENALKCFDIYKNLIEKIINHDAINENERNDNWKEKQNQLLAEVIKVC